MPSQKSSRELEAARAPKRQRGKDRVTALMAAASRLFAAKGYEAATMTEIAAEAGASIGSLYQFFPSKPALAAALLQEYLAQLHAALDDVAERVATLDAAGLARALIELMLGLLPDRQLALMMLEGTDDAIALRNQWRSGLRERLAALLQLWVAHRPAVILVPASIAVLQMMKAAPTLAEEFGTASAEVAELRRALQSYLQSLADT
ncbi:TetR/AcrR family transcriptional regulator [Frateuria aurantia]